MKKIKVFLVTLLVLLVISSPLLLLVGCALIIPDQHSESFVSELSDKFDRLNSVEGEKIVVVGGSSVAFGLDSALMEEYTGKPVVNFGLYAAIGTKAMLDLSRSAIGAGDVVILAPELDPQTLSLYFSSEQTLNAIDGRYDLALHVRGDSVLSLLGGLWRHTKEKIEYLINGAPSPVGVYSARSFNEYGDVLYEYKDESGNLLWERRENVMQFYYDPTKTVSLTPDILADDFADYLNEYIAYCESRGATVYFSWCPVNELSLAEGTTSDTLYDFTEYMKSKIKCEFISAIEDYIMDAGYFYDTNFHLNETGVIARTGQLIADLTFSRPYDIPEAPELPGANVRFDGTDENAKYFVYTEMSNGALMISGLSELGKAETTLTLPLGSDGIVVSAVGANAFVGGVVETVIIPEESNIRNLLDGSFDGSGITKFYIYYNWVNDAEKLSPASNFGGADIYLPFDSYIRTHYDWSGYSGSFRNVD